MRALGRPVLSCELPYGGDLLGIAGLLGISYPCANCGPYCRRPESILGFRSVRAFRAAAGVDRVHVVIMVCTVGSYERINPPGKDCRKNKSVLHSLSPFG